MNSCGEYEFTDVIQNYVKNGNAKVCVLPDECKYLNTRPFDSLLEYSMHIKEFEKNGLLGCQELKLYKSGKISEQELKETMSHYAKDYKSRIESSLKI